MKKLYIIGISVIIFIFLLLSNVFAHPGRTDSNGGHYDRSTGIYHYHNGGTNTYSEIEENSNNTDVTVEKLREESKKQQWEELLEENRRETIFEDYEKLSIASDKKSNTISDLVVERDSLIAEHYSVIKRLLICFSAILIISMFVCYNLGMLYNKNKYMIKK